MSATVPDSAADGSMAAASMPRSRWPRIALGIGSSVLEIRGATLFLRTSGVEVYLCTAEAWDWWVLREPGSFEAAAGKLRFSAARATAAHDP